MVKLLAAFVFAGLAVWTTTMTAAAASGDDPNCRGLPAPCICNNDIVNCTNAGFNSTDVFLHITESRFPMLDTLIMTGCHFPALNEPLFGDRVVHRRAKNVDLSNNSVHYVDSRAFLGLPNVQTLILANNVLRDASPARPSGSMFDALMDLRILNLERALFDASSKEKDDWLNTHLRGPGVKRLQYLHLQRNGLEMLPSTMFCTLPSLEFLYLANNSLSHFYAKRECLHDLKELSLSNNSIWSVGKALTTLVDEAPNFERLSLDGNPFKCTCELVGFIKWLKSSAKVTRREQTRCARAHPSRYVGLSLLYVPEENLKCTDDDGSYTHGVYIVCGLAVVGLLLLLLCIAYTNRSAIYKSAWHYRILRANDYQLLGKSSDAKPVLV